MNSFSRFIKLLKPSYYKDKYTKLLEFSAFDLFIIRYLKYIRVYKGRYSYQKKFINFKIKKGDLVLDIGSGTDPFPLATHLSDLYQEETTHRPEGSVIIKDKRPLVLCTVEQLPFKDGSFDFVYCSHLLEHVKKPARACEELMRVAKRGYIETPTRMSDVLFNFTRLKEHHRWQIVHLDNRLVFLPWRKGERRNTRYLYFFKLVHSHRANPFRTFFYSNLDLFRNMLLWKGKFDYIVINKKGDLIQNKQKFKKV